MVEMFLFYNYCGSLCSYMFVNCLDELPVYNLSTIFIIVWNRK
jgi:hypothetical protein